MASLSRQGESTVTKKRRWEGKSALFEGLHALVLSSGPPGCKNLPQDVQPEVVVSTGDSGGSGSDSARELDDLSGAVPREGASAFKNANNVTVNGGNITVVGRDNITNHFHSTRPPNNSDLGFNIADWLTPIINYRSIQIDTFNKRTAGTGKWFIEGEQFKRWLRAEISVLWAVGIPGAGKTILASTVINHLQKVTKSESEPGTVAAACAYCRYTERVSVNSILSTLIQQLVEDNPSLVEVVEPVYLEHQHYKTRPARAEFVDLLGEISKKLNVVYFVLDGIDEVPSEDQIDLLRVITCLGVQLLITSRRLANLESELSKAVFIDIVAQEGDIRLYICHRIDRQPPLQRLFEGNNLREKIISDICTKAQGMFLHASLLVETLRECLTVKDVEDAVEALPATTKDMYVAAVERIRQQPAKHAERAIQILLWLVFAHRSLTVQELQYALSAHLETNTFNPNNIIHEADLVSICCGLVTVDKESRLVRLVHFTAKDALQSVLLRDFPDPHSHLASVCVARLINCQVHEGEREYGVPFLGYAYDAWHIHARQCKSSLATRPISAFLRSCRSFPISVPVPSLPWSTFDSCNGLQLAAYYDLAELVDVGPDINTPTPNLALTPLMLAALGHEENPQHISTRSAMLLLQTPQIQVDATSAYMQTALILWAATGNEDVVNQLIRHRNINVDISDWIGRTALIWASGKGHDGVVGLLLDQAGIEVNATDENGCTALMLASANNHFNVVKLLLDCRRVKANATDTNGLTALALASRSGYERVVDLLLNHPEVEANAADSRGRTALTIASYYNHYNVVNLLLSHPGVDVNAGDWKEGVTALMVAAQCGRDSMVELLLSHPGVDVNAADRDGVTALMYASANGWDSVVKLLLSHPGVDVNAADGNRMRVLMYACKSHGKVEIVKLLLEYPGIKVGVRDHRGRTALDVARESGNDEIVRIIREASVGVTEVTNFDTPAIDSTYCGMSIKDYSRRGIAGAEFVPELKGNVGNLWITHC